MYDFTSEFEVHIINNLLMITRSQAKIKMNDEIKPSTELTQLKSALTNALKPAQSRLVLPTWDADVSLWLTRVDNAFRLGTQISEAEKVAAIAAKLPNWLLKILAP